MEHRCSSKVLDTKVSPWFGPWYSDHQHKHDRGLGGGLWRGGRDRPKFKRQALKRADEPGFTDALVFEALGISTRQPRRWRDAFVKHDDEAAFLR